MESQSFSPLAPAYLTAFLLFAQNHAACETVVALFSRKGHPSLADRELMVKPETTEEVKTLLENPEPWDEIALLNLRASCLHTLFILFIMLFGTITLGYYLPGTWPFTMLPGLIPVAPSFSLMLSQLNDYRKRRGKSRFIWKNEQDLIRDGQKSVEQYNTCLQRFKTIGTADIVRLIVILLLVAAFVTLSLVFVILPNHEFMTSEPQEKILRLDSACALMPANAQVTVTDELIRIGRHPKELWKLKGSVSARIENMSSRPVHVLVKKISFMGKDGKMLAEKAINETLNLNPGTYGYLSCTLLDVGTKAPVHAIDSYRIEYAVERVSDPFPASVAGESSINIGENKIYFTLRNPTEDVLISPDFTYAVRDGEGRLLYVSEDSLRYRFSIDPGKKFNFSQEIPEALSELLRDAPGPFSVDVLIKMESN